MTDSPTCSSPLHAALVAFQAEVTDVSRASQAKIQPRDKSKPAFGFPYADLATILAHVRPVLAKHGLAVVQNVECDAESVGVYTVLMHEAGQERTFGPLRLPAGDDNKATGGSITSARRFAILAALGIASVGEDSGDENGARRASSGNHATAKQLAKIAAEVDRGGVTDVELAKVLGTFGVAATDELTRAQASELIDRLIAEADRRSAAAAAGADPTTGEVKS